MMSRPSSTPKNSLPNFAHSWINGKFMGGYIFQPIEFSTNLLFNFSLIKSDHDRPSCVQMLQEAFIQKYENEANYTEFIKSVIEELQKDPI